MSDPDRHVPVLLAESLEFLNIKPSGAYFDATLGFGGHSTKILEKLNDSGKLIASDKDSDAFNFCLEKFNGDNRVSLYNTAYSDIDKIAKIEFIEKFDGILADLGVSSFQLDNPKSGFTFREDVPLDMRMNKQSSLTASGILNTFEEEEIANIIYNFGEERKSRQIARRICERRKIAKFKTSFQLKNLISDMVPQNYVVKTLTRVFQALRIYVNDELGDLELFLDKAAKLVKPGGRIVIISYHSLEDRMVKDKFKYEALDCICPPKSPICICDKAASLKLVSRKPIVPSEIEINKNKRARSAKMRVAEGL